MRTTSQDPGERVADERRPVPPRPVSSPAGEGEATNRESTAGAAAERRAAERRTTERRTSVGRRSPQHVLRQIVDRLADGIVVVSTDGRIRFANPAAERLFGRRARELMGEEFGYPLLPRDAAEIEIVQRGGGVIVAELRTVEVAWEEEAATLVSLRDVTDRREAEERARQLERERAARAEAEAANQAKSEFLAVMSHELRTPLNAVLGYAELLDLGVVGTLTAPQRQQVARIMASGRHLLGLVNEILDLVKVEAGHLSVARQRASVAEAVDAAILLAQPQAESRGLTLRVVPATPRDVSYVGDPDRVRQILANLLSNAIKFTDAGGSVEVSSRVATTAPSRHAHGASAWVAIDVRDTGIGVAPEQMEPIFSPFVQAETGHTRRQDGTGLGLTISRRLARLMRGDVTVESTVGQGSTFTLWLPLAEGPAPTVRAEGEEDGLGNGEQALRTRGLAQVGDVLLHELDSICDAFVARLRQEPAMPAAASLRFSQLADHAPAFLADIATALVILDESRGAPSTLLNDSTEIQRYLADRHGVQRARLGWTREALEREWVVLDEEVQRAICRCVKDPALAAQVQESIAVSRRMIEQGAETSGRALERMR